jgi:hypothetical protein
MEGDGIPSIFVILWIVSLEGKVAHEIMAAFFMLDDRNNNPGFPVPFSPTL